MMFLQLYLLCHNRPEYAKIAIDSILNQSDRSYELIISDNSTDDRVETLIKNHYGSLKYIKRDSSISATSHFNHCIQDVDTNYFCLFHDDDIMNPDYVSEMIGQIKKYPNMIAYGCNANIEEFGKLMPSTFFKTIGSVELIKNHNVLATRYFARSQSGIAPFPGYVYNKKILNQECFPENEGKYADVIWLLNLAKKAPILWISRSLMTYRLHSNNDSNYESRSGRLSLLSYLKKHKLDFGSAIIQDYRCSFIYKNIKNNNHNHSSARLLIANKFLNYYSWTRYLRFSTFKSLFRRALIKISALL